jgi:hypothetical protein
MLLRGHEVNGLRFSVDVACSLFGLGVLFFAIYLWSFYGLIVGLLISGYFGFSLASSFVDTDSRDSDDGENAPTTISKPSLFGPALFALLAVGWGVMLLLEARAASLHHSVIWVAGSKGSPPARLEAWQAFAASGLIIMFGLSYLAARLMQRIRGTW